MGIRFLGAEVSDHADMGYVFVGGYVVSVNENNVFVPFTSFQPCMSCPNSLQVASRQMGTSWPSTHPTRKSQIRAFVPVVGFMNVLVK